MTHHSPDRAYRSLLEPSSDETAFKVCVEESDLSITARSNLRDEAAAILTRVRGDIKNRILMDPAFLRSLVPLPADPGAPPIVREMLDASAPCGVGPMAAVAGAVAQAVAEGLTPYSPDVIVENGGDIFMRSTRERLVALLAKPVQGARLAVRIPAGDFPVSLCTSSATIGHSLSLGSADLVTVMARNGAFADAAATALCNMVKGQADISNVLEHAASLSRAGLLGVFIQAEDRMGVWGRMELTALE